MGDTLTLILAALVTARLTRLVTSDYITDPVRKGIVRRLPEGSRLAYLIMCPWCSSIYVAAPVAASWWAWGDTRLWAACAALPASSYVAGLLATHEGTD